MTDAVTPPEDPNATDRPTPTKRRVPWWVWAIAAVAVIAIILAITIAVLTSKSPFEAAVTECGLEDSSYAYVADGGRSLIVDMEGESSAGADFGDVACILIALKVPDAMIAKMDSTRALDGAQSGTFDDITVQWSYHPDDGLDLIFTR